MIGMGFAMVSAGAITDIQGIYPIIIGANIGTCVTGLLGSIGTTIEARRVAIGHLLFNIVSSALAVCGAGPHQPRGLSRQAPVRQLSVAQCRRSILLRCALSTGTAPTATEQDAPSTIMATAKHRRGWRLRRRGPTSARARCRCIECLWWSSGCLAT
ncbi:MAG: hypothetical protein DRP64_20675 [Verrucomicrobia bacterium]|nr:MAG: hypothetical protein DRP64_20675 [Verrucomicrobiota bacterium]RLB61931.1 MAG: hypothetical protein DRH08_13175 [Deltaproteobacteria bacterium]